MDASLDERFGRTVVAGSILFQEGDAGGEMYIIQSGRVQLTRKVRGREAHLATLPAGEFFGEMAIVNNRPRMATATVLEESRLLVIDGRTFEAMVRGNAEIALRFIKKLAARLEMASAQVEVLLRKDVNQRLAHYLRQRAATDGAPDGPGVRVDLSIEELARAIKAEPSEVAETLDRLERARLLTKDLGSIHFAEVGRLDEFLEFLDMRDRFGGSAS